MQIALALGACLAVAAAVACGAASPPYSAERPQRVMVFHTRRTDHARGGAAENLFWIPALDGNTPASLYPAGAWRPSRLGPRVSRLAPRR